jgi:hypothetical protein
MEDTISESSALFSHSISSRFSLFCYRAYWRSLNLMYDWTADAFWEWTLMMSVAIYGWFSGYGRRCSLGILGFDTPRTKDSMQNNSLHL